MQSQEGAYARTFVLIKVGVTPLPGDDKVEPPIAIDVGQGNAAPEQLGGHSRLCSNVVIAMVRTFDEKRCLIVSADIVTRTKTGPQPRIADQAVVRRTQRLQFRPAVYFALDKAQRLNDLKPAVIVEISHARVPSPTA